MFTALGEQGMWQCACEITWWPTLESMQVVPSGGQIFNQCKWRHLVAKFGTNASCAIWWPNLKLMQALPCGRRI